MKGKSDTIWIGNYFGYTGKSYDDWIIGTNGYSYTLLACMENGNVPKIIVNKDNYNEDKN